MLGILEFYLGILEFLVNSLRNSRFCLRNSRILYYVIPQLDWGISIGNSRILCVIAREQSDRS